MEVQQFLTIIGFVWLLLLSSCLAKTDNKHTANLKDTPNVYSHASDLVDLKSDERKTDCFDNGKPFKIISARRNVTAQSSAKGTIMCKEWNIETASLYTIIKDCQGISGTELDLSFEVLPCIIEGELLQTGKRYKFEINGGSWMYVRCGDTTLILGDYKQKDKKYFLSSPIEE